MARRLRIEYEGALYHVISRGNYRSPIFEDNRSKAAFLKCLFEACVRAEWILAAFVIMRNHYHLAIKTPHGNLSTGMQWLQSTFAARFNRFRRESGHVFQGRFKALLVESDADLAKVAHYIHLNPVRAKIAEPERLHTYLYSSYVYHQQNNRPDFLIPDVCLNGAGELQDTPNGWRTYARFLGWLAESEGEQKRLKFESLSRGWVMGTPQFRQEVARDRQKNILNSSSASKEIRDAKNALCEIFLARALKRINRGKADIRRDRKSAPWKIAIAAQLKRYSTAKNPWIAAQLNIGHPDAVSRYVSEWASGNRPEVRQFLDKISDIRV